MSTISIFLLTWILAVGQSAEVPSSVLLDVAGAWTGTLTYTDYKDDLSTTKLKCEMEATPKKKSVLFSIAFEEPNGKMYYDKSCLKLFKKGSQIKFDGNKYQVESFKKDIKTGNWDIRMTSQGEDNNKRAKITQVIEYTPTTLTIKKEVVYEGTLQTIARNQYIFKRK